MKAGSLSDKLKILEMQPDWEWPKDAEKTVLKALTQGTPDEKLQAANLAAGVMSDGTADAVLALIKSDGDPELRGRLAISLGPALVDFHLMGEIGEDPSECLISKPVYDKIRVELKNVYLNEKDELLRRRALEASVRAPEDWHVAAVRELYASANEKLRVTAVFCMGFLKGFEQEILASLNDPSEDIRVEAIGSAGEQALTKAGPEILKVARAPKTSREMRIAAVDALPYLNPRGTEELLESLLTSPDEELAEAAEDALEELEMFLSAKEEGDEEEDEE